MDTLDKRVGLTRRRTVTTFFFAGLAGLVLGTDAHSEPLDTDLKTIDVRYFPEIVEKKGITIKRGNEEIKGHLEYARGPNGYTEVVFQNEEVTIQLRDFKHSTEAFEFVSQDVPTDVGTVYRVIEKGGKPEESAAKVLGPWFCGVIELNPEWIRLTIGDSPEAKQEREQRRSLEEELAKFGKTNEEIAAVKAEADSWKVALGFDNYVAKTAKAQRNLVPMVLELPYTLESPHFSVKQSENFPPVVWGCGGVYDAGKGLGFSAEANILENRGITQVSVWATEGKIEMYFDLMVKDTKGEKRRVRYVIGDTPPVSATYASPNTFSFFGLTFRDSQTGTRSNRFSAEPVGGTIYTPQDAEKMMLFARNAEEQVRKAFPTEFAACAEYASRPKQKYSLSERR